MNTMDRIIEKNNYKFSFVKAKQNGKEFIISAIPSSILCEIAYAATRGSSDHKNAVQRVLRQDRIEGIRDFLLKGGLFPGSIILNWDSNVGKIEISDKEVTIDVIENSSQIIDGQHRVEGLKEAIKEKKSLGDFLVPVSIFVDLGTQECADIFLSINTLQRPVPTSLVHDLFGIASDSIIDYATVRARDIAENLNVENGSPYFGEIKFPGSRRRKGGISLSTAVSSIKPLVEKNGLFEQNGITDFKDQYQIISNFFSAIKEKYNLHWGTLNDVFYYSSGFSGALDFFEKKLIPYCLTKKSFKKEVIENCLTLSGKDIIFQEEVKKLSGKDASKLVSNRLNNYFKPDEPNGEFDI